VHIVIVTVGEKKVVIEEVTESEESDIIESENEEGVSASSPTSTPTTSGEVLGAQAENKDDNSFLIFSIVFLTLVSVIYLIIRKH